MKSILLFSRFLLVFLSLQVQAQKKAFTDEQLLKGARTGITQQLPQVAGWIDDSHLLINKKMHPDSPSRVIVVDCKTGKETPGSLDMLKKSNTVSRNVYLKGDDLYLKEEGNPEVRLTESADKEINPTRSPDNKYVAFTRNNDLYSINLETRKETRITKDGSELILNGYASWIYFEEILGRATRYRSFWWSPDSKSIAFMRMDDTKVPVFPLYNETGQHGSSGKYPLS